MVGWVGVWVGGWHRALIKLDASDDRGAVRVLSSDDRFVTPDFDTFNSLLSKHPPVPHDRLSKRLSKWLSKRAVTHAQC